MAESFGVLAQLKPSANTRTDALIVTSSGVVVSTITAANVGGYPETFTISVAKSGAVHADQQVIYPDIPLPTSNTWAATIGLTLGTGDVLRVMSAGGGVAFNAFGSVVS